MPGIGRQATSAVLRRGVGLGALAVAGAQSIWVIQGPDPVVLGCAVVATLVGCAGGTIFAQRREPGVVRGAAALLPAVILAGMEPLTANFGELARVLGGSALVLPAGIGVVWGISVAVAIGIGAAGGAGRRRSLTAASACLGVSLGVLLAPWVAAIFAGALLASVPPAARATRAAGHSPLGVLVGATALTVTVISLQPMLDPTPVGAVGAALGAMAGIAVGAAWAGRLPAGLGAAAGPLSAAIAWVALAAAPDLANDLVTLATGARPDRGRLLMVLPLALAGAFLGGGVGLSGGKEGGPRVGLAAAAGVALGLALPDAASLGWVAVGTGALMALGTGATVGRATGALVAVVVGLASWQEVAPDPADLALGRYRVLRTGGAADKDTKLRAQRAVVVATHGAAGAAVVRAPRAWAETAGKRGRPDRWESHVELAGLVSESSGREAEAESLAGHLAGLLPPRTERALVLGDTSGRALEALLQHPVGTVRVATPQPAIVQAIASLDPGARDAWLSPRVGLLASHPDRALRESGPRDVVIEVVRTPWRDGARAAPDGPHLDAVRDVLTDDGVYVLLVHLSWWDLGGPGALSEAVAERFGHLQVWVPPSGGDSMILVASSRPPLLASLEAGFGRVAGPMRGLGMTSAGALAGFAVGDRGTAETWGRGQVEPPSHRLGDAPFKRPILHLAGLADIVAEPEQVWDLRGANESANSLAARIDGRRLFLSVLGAASRGDMEDVFTTAQRLVAQEGALATRALDALIEPHMLQAREALALAAREGMTSSHWDDARRFATTARLLSPKSPQPPLVLGEIALAQGNLTRATEWLEMARDLDEADNTARTGLARVAMARRDHATAELLFREAASRQPQDWEAWNNLGWLLTETAQFGEAEEVLKRSAALAGSDNAGPHISLAALYLAWDRPTTALVHAERAVQLAAAEASMRAEAYFLRGRAFFMLDELRKAEQDFQQAVFSDSRHTAARGAIGHVRALQGDLPAAIESYRQVLAIDPNNAMARENLRQAEAEQLKRSLEADGGALPR
jgi:Tfp pilus assembly protein PilF/spermidine synthase